MLDILLSLALQSSQTGDVLLSFSLWLSGMNSHRVSRSASVFLGLSRSDENVDSLVTMMYCKANKLSKYFCVY